MNTAKQKSVPSYAVGMFHSPKANFIEKSTCICKCLFSWRAWRDSNPRPTGS